MYIIVLPEVYLIDFKVHKNVQTAIVNKALRNEKVNYGVNTMNRWIKQILESTFVLMNFVKKKIRIGLFRISCSIYYALG